MTNRRSIFSDAVLYSIAEHQHPTSFLLRLRGESPTGLPEDLILEPLFRFGTINICRVTGRKTLPLLRWILNQNSIEHVDQDFEIQLISKGGFAC
jgi:hypothetical protein